MAIKKIDLKAEHKYVSEADDALDIKKSDLKKYKQTNDLKYLVFKEKSNPTYFLLKNLSSKQWAAIFAKYMAYDFKENDMKLKNSDDTLNMVFEVFELGCKEVEENEKRSPISPDELEIPVLNEISNVLMAKAKLSEEEKKQ